MKRFLSLLVCWSLIWTPAYAAESTAPLTSATFTAQSDSATPFINPERGWAQWTGSQDILTTLTGLNGTTSRLASCMVNLSAYRTVDDVSAAITTLQTRFNTIRTNGYKCVLWMFYNFSGTGSDATATLIVSHLSQMSTMLKANADVIAFVKAGFVGHYGEWWGSTSGNSCNAGATVTCAVAAANRALVRDALLGAFHPLTHIQFRYPADVVRWYPTVITANQAYSGTAQSRVGIHIDCMLTGGNDTGTWGNVSGGPSGLSIEAEKTYAGTVGDYVAFGGEIADCGQTHDTTCASALVYFARYNLAWLKQDPPADFVSGWASCYSEIQNKMGYRLIYNGISHQNAATAGQSITASVTLRNVGWSRVHSPRKVQIVLTKTGETSIVCNSRVDLRALPANTTTNSTIAVNCTIPGGTAAGSWAVHLRIPDHWSTTAATAAQAIRPANTDAGGASWDSTNFRWTTGTTITVS